MSFPQRILALWLPLLPTDRILRRHGKSWRFAGIRASPLAVSRREANAQRIAALDEEASRLGLRPGMGVADARAMHPGLEFVEEDPAADRRLLEGLADWCDRYTPLVALDGADGLFLDITGCAHLFGGEEALMKDLLARLHCQGFEARAGLASTPGAAWAASRFRSPCMVPPGGEAKFLDGLPLGALRLEPAAVAGLESVGLRSASLVIAAPRAPVARRFGRHVLLRIDQALGAVEEAISPRLPVADLSVERRLAEPVCEIEDVERLVLLLAEAMKPHLEERGCGVLRLELALFRVDGAVSRVGIGAARPLRDPLLVLRLFRERLAALDGRIDAGFGFDLVRLAALALAPFADLQGDLAGEAAAGGEDAAFFADRVRARLGAAALSAPALAQSHVPERAAIRDAADGAAAAPPAALPDERPIRLLPRPDPVEMVDPARLSFRWRRVLRPAARHEGPERIAGEWWRDEAGTRDYFRVEDEAGRRYWVYREAGPEGAPPRWAVQGVFA